MSLKDNFETGTGMVTAVGAGDRFTSQFFETSFISEIVGTGDVLTVVVAGVGVCAVGYVGSKLQVVDLDDL